MPRAAVAKKNKVAGESLDARIRSLPVAARREAIDFIEFLVQKYQRPRKSAVVSEKEYWLQAAEQSVQKVWDNEEDDVYNELLQR